MKRIYTRFSKSIALFWVFTILFQVCFPVLSFAITNGPSQPETQGFQPAGTSNMVDLFTGDFQYSIPLFDLEGYPVNLSYQANPGMEDEASWVGLGWTLSPGSVDRNLRGLPDDFKGDVMKRKINMRDNITFGVNGGFKLKLIGIPKGVLGINAGIFYNNKKGPGLEYSLAPTFSVANLNKSKTKSLSAGLDLSYNTQSGFDVGGSLGLSADGKAEEATDFDLSLGSGINSREGVKSMNFSVTASKASGPDKPQSTARLAGGLTFGAPTYTPVPDLTFKTRSVTLDFGLGGELAPAFPNAHVGGFFSDQYLAKKVITQRAYGYLNSTVGESQNRNNLLDFNKEVMANAYSDKMKKLPMAYGTYDLFSAKAQGLGAQFRAYRGDIGVFRDAATHNGSAGISIALDLGAGNLFHGGGSVNVPWSNMEGGGWYNSNDFRERAAFTTTDGNSLYEPVAFKDAGEMMPLANEEFYNNVGMYDPAYVEVLKQASSIKVTDKLINEKNKMNLGAAPSTITGTLQKQERERRNGVFSYLNGKEAELFGLDKKIKSYSENGPACGGEVTEMSRLGRNRFHISEVNINQPGGSRYVFGIPVYNTIQKEVTFSTDNSPLTTDGPLVQYQEDEDDTDNKAGLDHYYESRETPPYATSYLLSGYLSPDYVDLTGNGISDDDSGTAVKFNYSNTGLYKWRSPAQNGTPRIARFNAGNLADPTDNKASYVYGERELWYMHSIESKNYVARFYTSERSDAVGFNEDGTMNGTLSARLKKLEKIEIYAKTELANNSNPTPIKTVHFVYSDAQEQDLCPFIPNHIAANGSDRRKLTLHKVYFTYGKSNRGAKNVYKFDYNGSEELKYATENVDRWGIYKDWDESNPGKYPPNTQFPYTYQPDLIHNLATKEEINQYASAWNLNKITLPTGSEITIEYESDTYAYVMNKRAGQYIFIKGFSETASGPATKYLYNGAVFKTMYNYIHLDLPKGVSTPAEFKKRYMKDVEHLYFNCKVQLRPGDDATYEYITGYADIDWNDITIPNSGADNVAILKLLPVTGDRGIELNPIVKAALTTLRSQLPNLAYGPQFSPPADLNIGNALALVKGFFPIIQDLGDLVAGFDRERVGSNFAKEIDVNHDPNAPDNDSWVRLANPTYNKFGGGSRVKKVTINDMWGTMADGGHSSAGYSSNYDYSMPSPDFSDEMISSGVACYEPMLGNDENLWRNPLNYNQKNVWLGPKTVMYQEAPVGEALFPAPVVGYSQVKVTSTPENEPPPPNGPHTRTNTGYSINRFYTAKDFPTKVDYTTLHSRKHKPNPVLRIFKLFSRANMTMSQGFMVEVNDMHGKPKSEEIYNEAGSMISSTEYRYKTDNIGNLNNTVKLIHPDGSINPTGTIGVDMDVWEEMSEEEDKTSGLGASFGIDVGLWGFFPAIFPHFLPIIHNDESRLRTAVTTKFIKRFGILDEVIKTQNGASLSSKNLVYDGETGEPLLVETQSEYDNSPVYQFKYPAHWAYDGMGQAYKNQDAFFEDVQVNVISITGEIENQTVEDLLNPGDEVIVYRKPPFNIPKLNTFYVIKENDHTFLIDQFGMPVNNTSGNVISIKVKRTARRNMATASIGSFESLINPVVNNQFSVNSEKKVLQASASTYNDKWRIPLAYKRVFCNNAASLEDASSILCYMTNHDEWWYFQPDNMTTLCDVSPSLKMNDNCDKLFYAMQPEPAYGYLNEYQLKIGDCIISLSRPDGEKFNPALLTCSGSCIPCGTPEDLDANITVNSADLNWTAVPGATSYNLQWHEIPEEPWITVNGITSNSYSLSNLDPCTRYQFRVQAVCPSGEGSYSAWKQFSTLEASGPCTLADKPIADVISGTEAKLYWDMVAGADFYEIEWRDYNDPTMPGNWILITNIFSTDYFFDGNALGVTGNIQFRVRAVCENVPGYFSCRTNFNLTGGNLKSASAKILAPYAAKSKVASQSKVASFVPGAVYDPSDCVQIVVDVECYDCDVAGCGLSAILESTDIFNPYFSGVLGNWRPQNTYAFDDKNVRDYNTATLKDQGSYTTFNPFWITGGDFAVPDDNNWVRANTNTKYDKAGNPVEEMDALEKFESAQFGFKNMLPLARASNARYTQIGYEGFEDKLPPTQTCIPDFCHQEHFPYVKGDESGINVLETTSRAHTGKVSLEIKGGNSVLFNMPQETPEVLDFAVLQNGQFLFGNGQIGAFQPVGNEDRYYVISAWVYSEKYNCEVDERTNPTQLLFMDGTNTPYTGKPAGPIIDGWRKIEEVVKLNANAPSAYLLFLNPFGSSIFLDDVRVHPFNSSMQSFAYDPFSFRLMATLDERNYATFYEYDDAGLLVRTKRETEKGIITVTETRSYLRPNN